MIEDVFHVSKGIVLTDYQPDWTQIK